MSAKILAILLTFFIFVAVVPSGANDVKLVKKTANQERWIKLDEMGANFLKALEEMKKLRLTDSLYKVVYSYELFQYSWKASLSSSGQTLGPHSSSFDSAQPASRLYFNSDRERYFEEGRTRRIFELLQLRREEMFNEIFMGFRFSFGSKRPVAVEMNISPFPEKGPGFVIAF